MTWRMARGHPRWLPCHASPTGYRKSQRRCSLAGEPFLVHQLRLLHSQGFRQIVLCVGHLGELIEAKIGNGKRLGLQIDYSFDGSTLLGTGGALKRAISKLGEQFLVIYGDSYMPIDYAAVLEVFVRSEKPALMTVFENEGRWDPSNVWFEAGKIHRYDKKMRTSEMRHIDYGISVLTADPRWLSRQCAI